MTTGVCRNESCTIAARGEAVERYPGPGEYCPECGELLAPATPGDETSPPVLTPEVEVLSREAYVHFRSRLMSALAPPSITFGWKRALLFATVVVLIAAGAAIGQMHPAATGSSGTGAIRVCRSSITERLAVDMVGAYVAKTGVLSSHFDVVSARACDVRFSAQPTGAGAPVVGHDGVVVVVNPLNPLRRLSQNQLRRIFTGEITDWKSVGGTPGPIMAMLPEDTTDEAQAFRATLLRNRKVGSDVWRLTSSAEVVRAIASASGQRRIGVVAFSAAIPAKVIGLADSDAPSPVSIADKRYPLSLAVTVDAVSTTRDPAAAGLVQYARSDAAQMIVMRDGLITKAGI